MSFPFPSSSSSSRDRGHHHARGRGRGRGETNNTAIYPHRGRGRGARYRHPPHPVPGTSNTASQQSNSLPLISQEERDKMPKNIDWDKIRKEAKQEMGKNILPLTESDKITLRSLDQLTTVIPNKQEREHRFNKNVMQHLSMEPEDAYRSGLSIARSARDYAQGKQSGITAKVLESLQYWLGQEGNGDKAAIGLTTDLKWNVFRSYLGQKSPQIMAQAFKICQLDSDPEIFLPEIRVMIKAFNFKLACDCAHVLHLHSVFAKEEFIIPLIVENKTQSVEEYLAKAPKEFQKEVVVWLDDLHENNFKKTSDLYKSHPCPGASVSRLQGKPLGKFVDKLVNKLELDPETSMPKLAQIRRHGALKHLVGLKDDTKMRKDNWRDLMYENIKGDDGLQERFLRLLTDGKAIDPDFEEAKYWVTRLGLQDRKHLVPYYLQQYIVEDNSIPQAQVEEENWDVDGPVSQPMHSSQSGKDWSNPEHGWAGEEDWDCPAHSPLDPIDYYRLKLSRESISFVDTKESFLKSVDMLCQAELTGLDTEHRPTSFLSTESVAIVQISTPERAFVLDINSLRNVCSDEDWRKLVDGYFFSPSVTILGFGLKGDFSIMAKSLDAFKELNMKNVRSVVDLELLDKRLTSASEGIIQRSFVTGEGGLSGLVEGYFNKKMDKRDQISDWDKRPLSEDQLIYAALDAFVLIELFEEMKSLAERESPGHFNKLVKELVASGNKISKAKLTPQEKETRKKESEEAKKLMKAVQKPLNKNPIRPKDVKIVCDNMLVALCKKLRLRGIDSVVIEDYEGVESVTKVALRDKRMILTKSPGNAVRLGKFVAPGHCLLIRDDIVDEQLKEVFRHFNVVIDKEDYFSRCSLCNGSKYLLIPKEKLKEIRYATNGDRGRRWLWLTGQDALDDDWQGEEVNLETGNTRTGGVHLKVCDVAEGVIEKQEEFFGCCTCGKIFWKGSHWDKVVPK